MDKIKAIWKILWSKQWVVITQGDKHSYILYSDRYKYPKIGPAHLYAEMLINNTKAVIRWLRCWADILEIRLYKP